jgi:hypothetical protein
VPAPQVKIEFKNGLISLEVRDAEIGEALDAVAEKTGIDLAKAIYDDLVKSLKSRKNGTAS